MVNDSRHALHVVRSAALHAARTTDGPLLLAVSGGLDSMALLSAMGDVARERVAAVATFDHATGTAARAAVEAVRAAAQSRGIPVVSARAANGLLMTEGREAAWRDARWAFLRAAARQHGARVATAHTADDQVETVLMRIMRGSGARGLAGLYAESAVVRPFLAVHRETIAEYAALTLLEWSEDPSNTSREFFRNRVRHDLLPVMRLTDAGVDASILAISRRAAELRGDVEGFVTEFVRPQPAPGGGFVVAASALAGYDRKALGLLWGALAGRAGVALDRRGTRRLAEFTSRTPGAGWIPLAGGWCLEAGNGAYVFKRADEAPALPVRLPLRGMVEWGQFRFRASDTGSRASAWTACVADTADAVVRAWGAGDRLEPAAGQPRRRVTRYLSDVGLRGGDRAGWPVVVAGSDVVWIPGVRRSDAATDRSGRPVRHYICERIDR